MSDGEIVSAVCEGRAERGEAGEVTERSECGCGEYGVDNDGAYGTPVTRGVNGEEGELAAAEREEGFSEGRGVILVVVVVIVVVIEEEEDITGRAEFGEGKGGEAKECAEGVRMRKEEFCEEGEGEEDSASEEEEEEEEEDDDDIGGGAFGRELLLLFSFVVSF